MTFINHEFISVEITVQGCALRLLHRECSSSSLPEEGCLPESQDPALLTGTGVHLVRYNLPDAASILEACLRCQVLKEK